MLHRKEIFRSRFQFLGKASISIILGSLAADSVKVHVKCQFAVLHFGSSNAIRIASNACFDCIADAQGIPVKILRWRQRLPLEIYDGAKAD